MTTDDWELIEAAFQSALALEGRERAAFLEQFSKQNPQCAERLERLIAADAGDDERIQAPIAGTVDSLTAETVDPWIGREVGAWTITERIAAGGMGAVFKAERRDRQFEQKVAVKILSAQLLSTDAVARFKAERQILAGLTHPYIAQLYDGGRTDDGVPYLVMEYVDGASIDQYCDAQRLDTEARLEVFEKVCSAIAYAHQNLVVHRDIKPSNVLVTDDGNPKLLDFGIAKLLDERSAKHTVAVTRENMRVMTPDYASPEQVRGETVSTATDVYSLGVLLYHLLTGHSPYEVTGQTQREVEKAILETDPKRPSTVVGTPTPSPGSTGAAEIGRRRGTSLPKLRKKLEGDLDNIVLKALRKEPERRYQSPQALIDDIRHYLNYEPVSARPSSWRYRTGKFLRRNALAASLTAIVLSLLLAFTGVTIVQNQRIAAERDVAEQVTTFLVDLFEVVDPGETRGNSVTAREVVDNAVEKISSDETMAPEIRSTLLHTLGRVYRNLGLYEAAAPLAENALVLREASFGRRSLPVAEALFQVGYIREDEKDLDAAQAAHEEALSIRRALLPQGDELIAESLYALGGVHLVKRDNELSRNYLEQSLELHRANHGEIHDAVGSIYNELGILDWRAEKFESAERSWLRALEINEQALGENHPQLYYNYSNVAWAKVRRGKLNEVRPYRLKMLKVVETSLGKGHPHYADALLSLSSTESNIGRPDLSEPNILATLEFYEARHADEEETYLAGALAVLAEVRRQQGRYDEAGAALERAIKLERAANSSFQTYLLAYLVELAFLELQTGETNAAVAHAVNVLDIAEANTWTVFPRMAAHIVLAESAARTQGDVSLHANAAYDLLRSEVFEQSKFAHGERYATLAQRLLGIDENEKAVEVAEVMIRNYRQSSGIDHPVAARTIEALIDEFESSGQPGLAEQLRKSYQESAG